MRGMNTSPLNEPDTVTLYRPTGQRELALVRDLAYRAWPPRLPEQPIFYPVLNEEYAIQIARDWNSTDARAHHRGFVTRFRVRADYLASYEVQTVGGPTHREYWIPAEVLDEFNHNIVGMIEVIREYRHGGEVSIAWADEP